MSRGQLHRQAVSLSCLGLDGDGEFVCHGAGLLQGLHHQSLRVDVGFRGDRADGVALGGGGHVGGGHQDDGGGRGGQEELRERESRGRGGGGGDRGGRDRHGRLVSSLYDHGVGGGLLGKVGFGHLLLLLLRLHLLLLGSLGERLLLLLLLTDWKAGDIFPIGKLRLDSDRSGSTV